MKKIAALFLALLLLIGVVGVQVIAEEQTIDLTDVSCGDVTLDGQVNSKDMLMFKQFIAGWSKKVDDLVADVNCDGVLNSKDSLYLRFNLAGWGNHPLKRVNTISRKPVFETKSCEVMFVECASTGYQWKYTMPEITVVSVPMESYREFGWQDTSEEELTTVESATTETTTELIIGSSNYHVFKFSSLSEGKTQVVFSYLRPWEEVSPLYTVICDINVNQFGKISCSFSGDTSGTVNYVDSDEQKESCRPTYETGTWTKPTYETGTWTKPTGTWETKPTGTWETKPTGTWETKPTCTWTKPTGTWIEPTGTWTKPTYETGTWTKPTYETGTWTCPTGTWTKPTYETGTWTCPTGTWTKPTYETGTWTKPTYVTGTWATCPWTKPDYTIPSCTTQTETTKTGTAQDSTTKPQPTIGIYSAVS